MDSENSRWLQTVVSGNKHWLQNVETSNQQFGYRNSDYYMQRFRYSREDLKSKTILDVGPGKSDFHKTVADAGGKLVRVDAFYPKEPPEDKTDVVSGTAEMLPFKDSAFDEALSAYCLYWTNYPIALKEMVRVVKIAGLVRIVPTLPKRDDFEAPEGVHWKKGLLEIKKPENPQEAEELVKWCIDNVDFKPTDYDPNSGFSDWRETKL